MLNLAPQALSDAMAARFSYAAELMGSSNLLDWPKRTFWRQFIAAGDTNVPIFITGLCTPLCYFLPNNLEFYFMTSFINKQVFLN